MSRCMVAVMLWTYLFVQWLCMGLWISWGIEGRYIPIDHNVRTIPRKIKLSDVNLDKQLGTDPKIISTNNIYGKIAISRYFDVNRYAYFKSSN